MLFVACFPLALVSSCTWLCSIWFRVLTAVLNSLFSQISFWMLRWVNLGVVARGQPSSVVGDVHVETKIPCAARDLGWALGGAGSCCWASALGVDLLLLAGAVGVLLVGFDGTLCWGVLWLLRRFGHVVWIRTDGCSLTWWRKHSLNPIGGHVRSAWHLHFPLVCCLVVC